MSIAKSAQTLLAVWVVTARLASQHTADVLDAELEPIRSQYNLPGLAAMAVKGGQILGQGAVGVRRVGDPTRIGVDDPINIGSCTKWITATMAGRLVDRGVVAWTTRIRDVFPNWAGFNAAYWDVTLEELLAHRGGVPEGTVWEPRFRPTLFTMNGSVTQLRRWVAEVTLAWEPQVARGTELYSNQGYVIAAVMLELRTGRSWETLLTEEVFAPLGMTSARIGSSYDSFRTPAPTPVGHDQANPSAVPVPRAALTGMDLVRYQAMAGPGGMVVCTLRDWARFLYQHALDGESYLTPATAKKLRTPWVGEEGYALGVSAYNRVFANPDKALTHSGDIMGQTALFWMAPATDLILVAYSNTAARGSASNDARTAAVSKMLARYRDAAPFGPYLDGRVPAVPTIRSQPAAVAVRLGESAIFTVDAEGAGPLEYQWKFNDVALPGATERRLTLSTVGADQAGYYSVDVRNQIGVTSSAAASLAIAGEGPSNRLSNLSVLASLAATQSLTVGFTLSEGAKPVLLRAVGPGLRAVGVPAPLANPAMALHARMQRMAENDDWPAGTAVVAATSTVGAFPLAAGSLDSVMLRTIDGSNTVAVESSRLTPTMGANSGTVLVEVYDAGASGTARLSNLSVLHFVGPGDGILTAGFTVSGFGLKRLLVRAVGPSLVPLGVTEVLDDPRLELFNSERARVMENDNWESGLAAAFAAAGAFPLGAGTRDAALVVSLAPGGYTVQVSGVEGRSGLALVEIYELR